MVNYAVHILSTNTTLHADSLPFNAEGTTLGRLASAPVQLVFLAQSYANREELFKRDIQASFSLPREARILVALERLTRILA